MQTAPAAFTAFQNQMGTQVGTILKLTDGTNTWLLSEMEAQLTDGHVYPLLKDCSIYQSFSIYTKQWTVASVQITLSNLPYKHNTSGVWVRLSDELTGITNRAAVIYYLCGGTTAGLTDCLTYYNGVVLEPPQFDDDTITVTVHNKSILYDKELPATTVVSVYTAAPPETKSLFIPLVYGDFTTDFAFLQKTGNGLAKCEATNYIGSSFVISNHVLDALTAVYVIPETISDIAGYITPILNVNDAGRGTGSNSLICETWLYPENLDDSKYTTDGTFFNALANAIDKNTGTRTILDSTYNSGNGTTIPPKSIYMMGFYNDKLLEDIKFQAQSGFKFSTYYQDDVTYLVLVRKRRLYFYNESGVGDRYFEESGSMPSSASYQESAAYTSFPTSTGSFILLYNWIIFAPVYTGQDLDDLTVGGEYLDATNYDHWYDVEIDGIGTPNTFKWKKGTDAYTTGVAITGNNQNLSNGIYVKFANTINHSSGDKWRIDVKSAKNDFIISGLYTGSIDHVYTIIVAGTGGGGTYQYVDVKRDGIDFRVGSPDATPPNGYRVRTNNAHLDDGIYFKWNTDGLTDHSIGMGWSIKAYAPKAKNANYMFGIYMEGKTSEGPLFETTLGFLYEARLKIKFQVERLWPIFAECRGREYDSWISSRSSAYTSGNMISDPSGIIESILRDELGFVDADIDLTTFIAAENTSVAARLNLHSDNRASAFDTIRQLAEQSTFAYVFTSTGKSRAIELDNTSPTVLRTIPLSHIKGGEIRVSKTSDIINKIIFLSRWQEEYDAFADNTTVDNSTSQTNNGIRRFEAEWPNIAGSSATHVANHLVGNSNSIWANQHNQIEFETIGLTNADLELGDWISIDYFAADPQFLCFGVSWSGKEFLVVKLAQTLDGTQIQAIELY